MSRPATPHRSIRPIAPRGRLALVMVVGLLAGMPGVAAAQGQGRAGIEGPIWQLLEYRDAEDTLDLVPPGIGSTINLWFDVISGEGACSSFRSSYTLQQETLIVDPPEVTERGCDTEAAAIDADFFRNLTETAAWSANGSILELRDAVGDVLMTFTQAQIPVDPTIAPWGLARIAAADGTIGPVIPGSDANIHFLRGGRVVGTTGCGWFLGSYSTNDTIVDISDVEFRREDCTADLLAQAERIVSTLDDITDLKLLPAGLTLLDASGTTRMALTPAIPLGDLTWTPIAVLDENGESLVEQARLRTSAVRFAGDRSDGRSVCRAFDAHSLRSGLALTVFDIEETAGRCKTRVQGGFSISQDAVRSLFLDSLAKASSHALRGAELELMDANGQPIMRLLAQPELVRVRWVLTAIYTTKGGREVPLPPQGNSPLTATFETGLGVIKGGVIQGETGKNSYIADYVTPRASVMDISNVETIGRKCNGRKARLPLCVQEATFISLLEAADGYVVAPEGLSLLKGSRKLLEFEQRREAPGS